MKGTSYSKTTKLTPKFARPWEKLHVDATFWKTRSKEGFGGHYTIVDTYSKLYMVSGFKTKNNTSGIFNHFLRIERAFPGQIKEILRLPLKPTRTTKEGS